MEVEFLLWQRLLLGLLLVLYKAKLKLKKTKRALIKRKRRKMVLKTKCLSCRKSRNPWTMVRLHLHHSMINLRLPQSQELCPQLQAIRNINQLSQSIISNFRRPPRCPRLQAIRNINRLSQSIISNYSQLPPCTLALRNNYLENTLSLYLYLQLSLYIHPYNHQQDHFSLALCLPLHFMMLFILFIRVHRELLRYR